MPSITVGTNSWVTEAEANTYMSARISADEYWTNEASDNIPALITAYVWLNSGKFTFPDTATDAMKNAQCEMALFLIQHQPDIDLRLGLQVQGVIAAGVVKERYREDNTVELPIPPIVSRLLSAYDGDRPVYMVNLERNEEEGVDYAAYNNLLADEAGD
ncbi:MAG: hypothetical protein PHQ43_00925 [Dehalococcoidales bacterium]|nr:hypothetical protein [Dehalococcoidales bacterium]